MVLTESESKRTVTLFSPVDISNEDRMMLVTEADLSHR